MENARNPRVERVKIFLNVDEKKLEAEYNDWVAQNRGVMIAERQYRVTTHLDDHHQCCCLHFLAIFYTDFGG